MALGGRVRRGQFRIIELILAISMLVSVILLIMHFTRPMRSVYLREVADLRKVAYNLLNNLAEAGAFEQIIDAAFKGDMGWEGRMRMLIASSLPVGTVFRMEIHHVIVHKDGRVELQRLDSGVITNVNPDAKLLEAEAVYYTLVCTRGPDRVRGEILYIVLVIGYAG